MLRLSKAFVLRLIHIIDRSKKIGTTTNASGYFEIAADTGNIIMFSSVQSEVQEHIVIENDLQSDDFIKEQLATLDIIQSEDKLKKIEYLLGE